MYYFYTRPLYPNVRLVIAEDNEAVIKIISKCRSTALRHLHCTHHIDVNLLSEVCGRDEISIRYINIKHQLADINTKAMTKNEIWVHLLELCQI